MGDDDLLRLLARASGIETGYWDIRGAYHDASPETLRVLLGVLGVPAGSDKAVKLSLASAEKRDWQPMPPVCVCWDDDISLSLSCSPDEMTRPIRWRIEQEDGAGLSGDVVPNTLIAQKSKMVEGETWTRVKLPLPDLPAGYHRICLERSKLASEEAKVPLIVAPRRCYLPAGFDERKYWGISLQLYGLRSERNLGIGDFADLKAIYDWAFRHGADVLGVNPLHAGFSSAPNKYSPYSPNSRQFLNPLYLDIAEIAAYQEAWSENVSSKLMAACASLRSADMIAYDAVSRAKLETLAQLFMHFQRAIASNSRHPLALQFGAFCSSSGKSLKSFAAFEALAEAQGTYEWASWPRNLRDPASSDVSQFANNHGERIAYFQYLQWHAERQLRQVVGQGQEMPIGLYGDLAMSTDPDGFDTWNDQRLFRRDVRIGAPPDPFNASGQEWGIVPLAPNAMRENAYSLFSSVLRANMRHFGMLRIDHAMGLERLYWIPAGAQPSSGTYVRYPREELLAIVSLESHRNRCVVVGEDLGTVPADFRPRMAESNVLSYRVLYFERDNSTFRSPDDYPHSAVACAATHDLPTLKGFWSGADIQARFELGQSTREENEQALEQRMSDKKALVQALIDEKLIFPPLAENLYEMPLTHRLADTIHSFLARSSAAVFIVQMDDLVGESNQANLPGTSDEYPNWRRKLAKTLAQIEKDREMLASCETIAEARAE